MTKKRILSFILSLAMVLTLFPIGMLTVNATTETFGAFNVTYSGAAPTYSGGVLTISTVGDYTIENITPTIATIDTIVVSANANITLNGVNINLPSSSSIAPFTINSNANVTLTLQSNNFLITNANHYTGLVVDKGTSLTINGAGSLNAKGCSNGAGIGGFAYKSNGDITINSGTITAQGERGAGIGAGGSAYQSYANPYGNITINGGSITATSTFGAGIGGGVGGNIGTVGTITINGGTINASSDGFIGSSGAGIGGALYGSAGNIVLSGGNIKASSKYSDAVGNGSSPVGNATVVNSSNTPVYKATFTAPNATANGTDASALTIANYATTGITTLDTNKVYVYLPAGDADATYNSKKYTATVTTDGTGVFDKEKDTITIKHCLPSSAVITTDSVIQKTLPYTLTAQDIDITGYTLMNLVGSYDYEFSNETIDTYNYHKTNDAYPIINTNLKGTTSGEIYVYYRKNAAASDLTPYITIPTTNQPYSATAQTATVNQANATTAGLGTISLSYKRSGVDVAVPKDAGTYDIYATVTEGNIFAAITTPIQVGTFNISQRVLTPSVASVASKSYDVTTAGMGTISLSGAVGGETPTATGTFDWTSANVGTTTVNVTNITLGNGWTTNYTLTASSLSNVPVIGASINRASTTINISATPSGTQSRPNEVVLSYNGLPNNATGIVSFYNGSTSIGTVTIGNPTQTVKFAANGSVNNYVFQAIYSGDSNCDASTSNNINYTFTKSNESAITINNVPTTPQTYGDTFTVSVSSGNGTGALVYASTNTSVATVNSSTGEVKLVGTGTFKVTAYRSGDNDYNQSTTAQSSDITVNARKLTVNNPNVTNTKVYDTNATATAIAGTITNKVATDDITVSISSATYDNQNAGANKTITIVYQIGGTKASNYTKPDNYVVTTGEITPFDITGAIIGTFGVLTFSDNAQTPVATVTKNGLAVTGAWSDVINVNDKTTFTANGNFTGAIADKNTGMAKAIHAAPSTITKLNVTTIGGNDGKIQGVDSTMEYSDDNKSTYKQIDAAEIPNLSKGIYYVRYKETDNYNISDDSKVVIDEPIVVKSDETVPQDIVIETPIQSSDKLEIEVAKADTVNATITEIAGRNALAITLDITAKVNDSQKLTLDNIIKITLPIPDVAKGRPIQVYRLHNGTATILPDGETNKNIDGEYVVINSNTIDVYAKNFSQYAIGYTKRSSSSGSVSTFYNITVSQSDDGKISPESQSVVKNGTRIFTITPNEGYKIEDVLVNGKSVGAVESYTFNNVTSNSTITASYKKIEEKDKPETTDWKNPFIDVNNYDWFYDVVKYVNENELMNGISETQFSPDGSITRAMFVTVLYRIEKEPTAEKSPFVDVESNSYYEKAVAWAAKNKIVKGISDTEFAPNDNITREQMAAIAFRYAYYKKYDISISGNINYADKNSISDYAKDNVVWAADKGIMSGNPDNTFAPQENSTRAQAAAVFMRIIEKLQK